MVVVMVVDGTCERAASYGGGGMEGWFVTGGRLSTSIAALPGAALASFVIETVGVMQEMQRKRKERTDPEVDERVDVRKGDEGEMGK